MPSARRLANSLAPGIAALTPSEGLNSSRAPSVVFWRMTAAQPPTPTLYSPSLILVGSGEKRASFANEVVPYNADHALLVTTPMPMLCEAIATRAKPVLTMVVALELSVVRELLTHLPSTRPRTTARTIARIRLSEELEDASARLLRHLADDGRTAALASSAIRELLYLVLDGPGGDVLRGAAESTSRQLAPVLRHMNARFAEQLTVEALARLARMSVPTFHQRFKETTGLTPLHYVKTLRLMRAKQLLHAGGFVKNVARTVGYSSESQFSREYRRFYGNAPSAESTLRPRERV